MTASHAAPPARRRPTRGRATGSTLADRRAAAVAVATVADAIQRWQLNYDGSSRGLRGGRWTWRGDRLTRFRFRAARLTRDVPVYGGATWRLGTGAVRADLRIPHRGRLLATWNVRQPLGTATLTGRRLRAMPAP